MLIKACLRKADGQIVGKANVNEDCTCVAWGGKWFEKTMADGEDDEGPFYVFAETSIPCVLYERIEELLNKHAYVFYTDHLHPMRGIKFLSA